MNEWKFKGKPIKSSVIDRVESTLAVVFPADYKSFIVEHSGAKPVVNEISLSNGASVVFEQLLHIDPDNVNSVTFSAKSNSIFSQQNLVPFGEDPFGNMFCFKFLQGSEYEIIYWEHETNAMIKICESFSELLNLLHTSIN